MSKLLLSTLALFVLHDGICGSFHNKATINASVLLCVPWQTLDEDSFDMLYKNDCWAAIPDPIWTPNVPYERKINMLSSTANNFMICLFEFERISIESRFLSFFNSHCIYVYLYLHIYICLFIYLSIYISISRYFYPSTYRSYLSV